MKLKEIFDQLTYGELSQISIGGGEAGEIASAQYDRVLAHINLGLAALYKRFNIKQNRLTLQLIADKTAYLLRNKYAVSSRSSREPVRYILDSVSEPYKEDLLKIERVVTETGTELGLNNLHDEYSCFTPSTNMLVVPATVVANGVDLADMYKTSTLDVYYRACHTLLVTDGGDIDPELVEVDLPYAYLEPLLLFVAARVHTPVGMVGEFNAGNNYMQKYELACQQLEQTNLQIDRGSQSDRLIRNGWV